jgi:glutamate-1-semialdehyde 2,1-aminomutase
MSSQIKYARSQASYERARKYLPGGVSSNFRLGMKPFPLFFDHAKGAYLFDVDGNEYVDYVLGMGPVILGHAHPEVEQDVHNALRRGQLFAGQHDLELELAAEVCSLVPCAEMVRFSLSGSEAVQAALRAARAFTGRNRIVKFEGHYHGWFDNVFVSVKPLATERGEHDNPNVVPASLGQDPNAYLANCILPWNNPELVCRRLEQEGNQIAAVVMEPIMCNTAVIPPNPGYIEQVRDLCTKHGILLIFDEVITGFRVGLDGAQGLFGVVPDIAIFAKAMANGFPMSCLAGRGDIMELFGTKPVVHGGTFNTNTVSCAAALATLRLLKANGGEIYGKISRTGKLLMDGLRSLAHELGPNLIVQGFPAVFHTTFGDMKVISDYRSHQNCVSDLQSLFIDRMLERGVRITSRGTWFVSAAHTEVDVEVTLKAARSVLSSFKKE